MAAPAQQAPSVMAAGQDQPGRPVDPVRAHGAALIQGLQTRIQELEQASHQNLIQRNEEAQGYEDQLFDERQRSERLGREHAELQTQNGLLSSRVHQLEAELGSLQQSQQQNTEQIAALLREIAVQQNRLQLQRQQEEFLTRELGQANARIAELTLLVRQLQATQRAVLANVQRDDFLTSVFKETVFTTFEAANSVFEWLGLKPTNPRR